MKFYKNKHHIISLKSPHLSTQCYNTEIFPNSSKKQNAIFKIEHLLLSPEKNAFLQTLCDLNLTLKSKIIQEEARCQKYYSEGFKYYPKQPDYQIKDWAWDIATFLQEEYYSDDLIISEKYEPFFFYSDIATYIEIKTFMKSLPTDEIFAKLNNLLISSQDKKFLDDLYMSNPYLKLEIKVADIKALCYGYTFKYTNNNPENLSRIVKEQSCPAIAFLLLDLYKKYKLDIPSEYETLFC